MKYMILKQQKAYSEIPVMDDRFDNLTPYKWTQAKAGQVLYIDENSRAYETGETLFIAEKNGDINIPGCSAKIMIADNIITLLNSGGMDIFLNQEKLIDGEYAAEEGAILLIDTLRLILGKGSITVWGVDYETGLMEIDRKNRRYEGYPIYKRSPRLIKRIEESKIKIEQAPKKKKMGARGLLQMILPPICMLIITLLIGVLLKRGLYIMMSASMMTMTAIFTVTKYFHDKKENKETEKKQKEIYTDYLLKKRKEINKKWHDEKEAYEYNYPEVEEINDMICTYSNRIYEKSSMDDDFLTFSVGHSLVPTAFKIESGEKELDFEANDFKEEIEDIKKRFSLLDKPEIVDLKEAHLGLVGEKSIIHSQLKHYVSQIAFTQSYHDVQFVSVYDQSYEDEFKWMRWLPHGRIRSLNILGLVHSDNTRDQILSSMQQIIKERKQKVEDEKKEARFLPHYIFIIDEPKMVIDHSIMEFLGGADGRKLGFSIIYTTARRGNLPDNIETVLLLENSEEGRLLLEEKVLCNKRLHLYDTSKVDMENMARILGALQHEQGMANHMPESITFFDMYGITDPREFNSPQRWHQNNSSKSLSVPLGARAKDDYLSLNLHEKAHGPHGLVAGTTGSGKSEIVQSYILSLAVNFHPHEVGFLLIDYKGGGMANLFEDLPHLLGTITNLDGSESMRALASIQSELRRRQRIFGEYDVNHINAYNDLFKKGKAREPIPHLFIISDEFAELKKEQPEFMKELVSTARIGRSLGVHLILATQKPTGVVDDQIWTNSKFKLCLKVQNEADSKEVLHTPDAANITQAGRAYLQVGNNEIYELFQSAWSGAMYIKEKEKEVTEDNRVYLVNELGQGELINKDLRGSKQEQQATQTQLDATVGYIKEVYEKEKAVRVKKPWLPSLPDKMVNPHMDMSPKRELDLSIAVGMIDIPEEQKQEEYMLELTKDGNALYIASSGYGKSIFLTNVGLDLAAQNTVSNLNLYTLDFGNNALIALANLPHMASYIMLDEEEKFEKFRKLMRAEVKRRKRLFAKTLAQNFMVYNEKAEEHLNAIVILVDNFDVIKEMGYDMEDYFTKLSRDGVGLGIYLIITASRGNAIRAATMNNFKEKIAGFNFDEQEVKNIVGRSHYTLPDIRGRAMAKVGDTADVMQMYTPVNFETTLEYSEKIKSIVDRIREKEEYEAEHIPMIEETVKLEDILKGYDRNEYFALGLEKEWVNVAKIRRGIQNPFLILGDSGSGKTNCIRIILNQIPKDEKIYIFDSRKRDLYDYMDRSEYIIDFGNMEKAIDDIKKEADRRTVMMEEGLKKGKRPQDIIAGMEHCYVVIDDIDDFCELAKPHLPTVAIRFEKAIACGITFIVSANVKKFKGGDDVTKFAKNTSTGLLLSSPGYFTLFPVKASVSYEKNDGCLMIDGKGEEIRLPEAKKEVTCI